MLLAFYLLGVVNEAMWLHDCQPSHPYYVLLGYASLWPLGAVCYLIVKWDDRRQKRAILKGATS